MPVRIPMSNNAYFSQVITLEESAYRIEFKWVSVDTGFWVMSLYDSSENPIVYGIRLVLSYPLGFGLVDRGLPPGVLMCIDLADNDAEIGRFDFVNERGVILYYYTKEEALALGFPIQ